MAGYQLSFQRPHTDITHWLLLHFTKTNIGNIAFKFFASHKWNTVQVELKLTKYLSVNQCKSLLDAKDVPYLKLFNPRFSDFILLWLTSPLAGFDVQSRFQNIDHLQ